MVSTLFQPFDAFYNHQIVGRALKFGFERIVRSGYGDATTR